MRYLKVLAQKMSWTCLIFLLFLGCSNADSCPSRCVCSESTVTCTNLNQLPESYPPQTTSITFHKLHVTAIPSGAFMGLPKLKILEFRSSYIKRVESHAFDGFSDKEFLSIYRSTVETIETFAFSGNKNISMISIYGTTISNIAPQAFNYMKNIQDWQMYSLDIGTISSYAFHEINGVLGFMFFSNKVKKIATHAFSNLRHIKDFQIYRNKIDALECYNIEDVKKTAEKTGFYNNDFVCGCRLAWLLDTPTLQHQLSSNKCHFRNSRSTKFLKDLSLEELDCPAHADAATKGCPPQRLANIMSTSSSLIPIPKEKISTKSPSRKPSNYIIKPHPINTKDNIGKSGVHAGVLTQDSATGTHHSGNGSVSFSHAVVIIQADKSSFERHTGAGTAITSPFSYALLVLSFLVHEVASTLW